MRRLLIALTAVVASVNLAGRCQAQTLAFEGQGFFTEGGTQYDLNAWAQFKRDGDKLEVTLSNTNPFAVQKPGQVLTGVFFDVSTNPALSRESAEVAPGSSVLQPPGSHPGYPDIGGEWGFRSDIGSRSEDIALTTGQAYGIGAAGFGLFGPDDRFNTSQNLTAPPSGSPGGVDWGLTTLNDTPGGAGATGSSPLIQNSAVFTLTGLNGLNGDLSLEITNVRFQYGSGLEETSFVGTMSPEPGTLGLLGLGAASLLARRRRRRA